MVLKLIVDDIVADKRSARAVLADGRAQTLVFVGDLAVKSCTDIFPQHRVLSVVHRLTRIGVVDVFQKVIKCKITLVVGAERGVSVIKEHHPSVGRVPKGRECVLFTLVDAEEDFREQIIKHKRIHVRMVGKLRLEFCQAVFRCVCGVGHTVIGHSRAKSRPCCRICVGGLDPRCKCRKVGCVNVILGISRLEVVLPCGAGEIVIPPAYTVGTVLQDFPRFITVFKAEDFLSSLVVIKIELADKGRCCSVVPKNDDGMSVDGLPHTRILLLRRGLDGTKFIVQLRKHDVVRALGGGDVCFHRVGCGRHRIAVHLIDFRRCAVPQNETALELNLEVFNVIVLR